MNRKSTLWAATGVAAFLVFSGTSPASTTFRRVVGPALAADGVDTFVSLRDALVTPPSLSVGAVIEIAPGAPPSVMSSVNLTVSGLTIRGAAALSAPEVPSVTFSGPTTLSAPNVRLENLNLVFETNSILTVTGSAFTLTKSAVFTFSGTNFLVLDGASPTLSSNTFNSWSVGGTPNPVLRLQNATQTIIRDNDFFQSGPGSQFLIAYNTTGSKNDLIEGNRFFGPVRSAGTAVTILSNVIISDLTIRDNVFADADISAPAVYLFVGCQNIVIEGNRFVHSGYVSNIYLSGAGASGTTSLIIRGNDFVGDEHGVGLDLALPNSGDASVIMEGNRFRLGRAIQMASNGATVASVDAGGGAAGSLGGNDFSYFTAPATADLAAITTYSSPNPASLSARGNVFGADPETVVHDKDDTSTLINVDTANPLTGNRAYVALLYARFLRKGADFSSNAGAGGLVDQLAGGATARAIARAVIYSDKSLGRIIDEDYRAILGRSPTAAERARAVLQWTEQGKREEDLIVALFSKAEGTRRYHHPANFVYAIFAQLVNREPTASELTNYSKLASLNRANTVSVLLGTSGYKRFRATSVFQDILRRNPSAAEMTAFLSTDRLALLAAAAQKLRAGL